MRGYLASVVHGGAGLGLCVLVIEVSSSQLGIDESMHQRVSDSRRIGKSEVL